MALIQVDGAGDYASLNAAIVPCTGGEVITISETWAGDDTTSVVWDQAVTVNVTGSAKNTQGYPDQANTYRHTESSGHAFTVTAAVVINDMDIMSNSTGVSDEIFHLSGVHSITCRRCHIGFSGNTDQQDLIYHDTDGGSLTWDFESCMFYDVGRSIIDQNGSSSTITVNFNGCSSLNIGANGGRNGGTWFGEIGGGTSVVNVFNCLITGAGGEAFHFDGTSTFNADYNITSYSSGSFAVYQDTDNQSTGNTYGVTFVEGEPTDVQVGLIETGTSPYDQRLYDHANNIAIDAHSVETGPDSGLAIANDIIGTVRGASEDHDIGAFEITAGGGGSAVTKTGAITPSGVPTRHFAGARAVAGEL